MPDLFGRKKRKKLATPESATKKYEKHVAQRKARYADRTEEGFRMRWVPWYNYMMLQILKEYDTLKDLDPFERSKEVQSIISDASAEYRDVKVGKMMEIEEIAAATLEQIVYA